MRLWKKLGMPEPKTKAPGGKLSLRESEIYSGLKVPKDFWLCVRLDGWNFHSLTNKLERPYDEFFARCLVEASKKIMELFSAKLAYIFSDEISLIFPEKFSFSRRVEKIDSVFSGLCSTVFLKKIQEKYKFRNICFDCRCIPLEKKQIKDYLMWRQGESVRNFYNNWSQYALIQKNLKPRKVSRMLQGKSIEDRIKVCREEGIKISRLPKWQKYGIVLRWEEYEKEGYDPKKEEKVVVTRRNIVKEWCIGDFREDVSILDDILD